MIQRPPLAHHTRTICIRQEEPARENRRGVRWARKLLDNSRVGSLTHRSPFFSRNVLRSVALLAYFRTALVTLVDCGGNGAGGLTNRMRLLTNPLRSSLRPMGES